MKFLIKHKKTIAKIAKIVCFGVVPYLVDVAKEALSKQAGFSKIIVKSAY